MSIKFLDLDLYRQESGLAISNQLPSTTLNLDLFRDQKDESSFVANVENPDQDRELVKNLHSAGKTFREIEKETGIPKSSASDLLQNPHQRRGEFGRRPYLKSLEQRKKFEEKVTSSALAYNPPDAAEIALIAGEILSSPEKEIRPSESWAQKFAHSQKDTFQFARPKQLEPERACVDDPNILLPWHDKMGEELHPEKVKPHLTFNMDEFKLELTPKKPHRALFPKTLDGVSAVKPIVTHREHITVCLFSSPDPDVCRKLRHTVILPLASLPHELEALSETFDFAGVPNTGWTNEQIFNGMTKNFVGQVDSIRLEHGESREERALLWLDADESRRSPEGLETLRENHVDVGCFLAKATTINQPDDKGLIGSVKQKMGSFEKKEKADRRKKGIALPSTLPDLRKFHLGALKKAVIETFSLDERTISAWRSSSLFPFDRKVLIRDPQQSDVALHDSKFEELMKQKPGKKLSIAGRVLTRDEIIGPLKDEKNRTREKKSSKTQAAQSKKRSAAAIEDADSLNLEESSTPPAKKARLRKSEDLRGRRKSSTPVAKHVK